jgi:hypothetical protein
MLGVTNAALAAAANLLLSPQTHAMYSIAGAPFLSLLFFTLHFLCNYI